MKIGRKPLTIVYSLELFLWIFQRCIPHSLLIAKLHTFALTFDAVTFIYFDLKERKQNVKNNNIYNTLQFTFRYNLMINFRSYLV